MPDSHSAANRPGQPRHALPDSPPTPDAIDPAEDPGESDEHGAGSDSASETTGQAPGNGRVRRTITPRRAGRDFLKPGRSQILVAVVLLLVSMGVVMQVRAKAEDSDYSAARREDLVGLVDGLNQEQRRLEDEIGELERTRTELESGNDSEQVARDEADRRLEVLRILAGTAPAVGPGVRITIDDPQGQLTAHILLDAVEELRDSGAEVIEINNKHRVVAQTWFASNADGLIVDGEPVTMPLTLEVIGDPHALEEGARFRGGLVSEVTAEKIGGIVDIERMDLIRVDSVHTPPQHEYAKPR